MTQKSMLTVYIDTFQWQIVMVIDTHLGTPSD